MLSCAGDHTVMGLYSDQNTKKFQLLVRFDKKSLLGESIIWRKGLVCQDDEGGVKDLPFLTGFTFFYSSCKVLEGCLNLKPCSITSVPFLPLNKLLSFFSFWVEFSLSLLPPSS